MEITLSIIVRILGAFLSILAFSVYLETPKKHIIKAGLVGAIGGFVYLAALQLRGGDVLASFLSALAVAIVSHIFARIFKTPVTIFLVAGILPTVPGAGMYRIVHHLLVEDEAKAAFYMIQTLEIAGAIALAIFLVDSVFRAAQRGNWKNIILKLRCNRISPEEKEVNLK